MAILLFDLTYKQLIKYVENDANFYYNVSHSIMFYYRLPTTTIPRKDN